MEALKSRGEKLKIPIKIIITGTLSVTIVLGRSIIFLCMVNKPSMEHQKQQHGFSEDTIIRLFFQRYGKSLIKEALLEFLAENELKIVSTKESNSQLLTTHETAKLLSVNRHTLYKYMNMGLPSFRVGKSHRFRIEDIKAFVAKGVRPKS